jgi:transcription termination/antitermination protein NusA
MNKDLLAIFEYLERERGIKREIVVAAIEESLLTAAQKGAGGEADVRVSIDSKTGEIHVVARKQVVQRVTVPAREISLKEALKLDPQAQVDQMMEVAVPAKDFGRIAAQKAQQIISQKLRSAERDVIHEEYRHRVGDIVSGTVKRFVRGANLIVDLGKVEALMPMVEYPKTERYKVGDRVQALLMEVRDSEDGGAEVVLSRSSPDFVKHLFAQEVPEIGDGTVSIERVVREAGYRTKVVVRGNDPRVDPVGACVGMRGTRVKNVVRELLNEKVDIVPYAADRIELLQNALDPVEIRKVSVSDEDGTIAIVVDDADYPTVIGKKGMNVRLLGRLVHAELEVQRMGDYTKATAVQQLEMAESADTRLDSPLKLEGISSLVIDQLVEAGIDTLRKLLKASREEIAALPGIRTEMAEKILDSARKQVESLGEESQA